MNSTSSTAENFTEWAGLNTSVFKTGLKLKTAILSIPMSNRRAKRELLSG